MNGIASGLILSLLGSDFPHFIELPSVGASGGILVAWRHSLGPAATVRIDNFCLSVQFSPDNNQPWWFTAVYGTQGDDNKLLFLQELREVYAA